jgi:hypothetical protein
MFRSCCLTLLLTWGIPTRYTVLSDLTCFWLKFWMSFRTRLRLGEKKNQVYSLIGGFCGSPVNFHAKDGSGYKFLGEVVLQLDKINPQVNLEHLFSYYLGYAFDVWRIIADVLQWWICNQVASRMVSAFSRWRRYDETRQALAKVMITVSLSHLFCQ